MIAIARDVGTTRLLEVEDVPPVEEDAEAAGGDVETARTARIAEGICNDTAEYSL